MVGQTPSWKRNIRSTFNVRNPIRCKPDTTYHFCYLHHQQYTSSHLLLYRHDQPQGSPNRLEFLVGTTPSAIYGNPAMMKSKKDRDIYYARKTSKYSFSYIDTLEMLFPMTLLPTIFFFFQKHIYVRQALASLCITYSKKTQIL